EISSSVAEVIQREISGTSVSDNVSVVVSGIKKEREIVATNANEKVVTDKAQTITEIYKDEPVGYSYNNDLIVEQQNKEKANLKIEIEGHLLDLMDENVRTLSGFQLSYLHSDWENEYGNSNIISLSRKINSEPSPFWVSLSHKDIVRTN